MDKNNKKNINAFVSKMKAFTEFVKGQSIEEYNNTKDYEVGYGKPPESGKFKKGQSGNPKGRKKKVVPTNVADAIKYELSQTNTILNSKGVKEKVPTVVLLAKVILKDALAKDGNSRKLLLQSKAFMNADVLRFAEQLEKTTYQNEENEWLSDEERKLAYKFLYDAIDHICKNADISDD